MSVDKIIQLNRTKRRALLIALVIIAAVGLYRWILAPYGSHLLAAQKYDFALNGVLRKGRILAATIEEQKNKIEELSAESVRLRSELFMPKEVRSFFSSLPAVAGRTGCLIQSINTPPEQQGGLTNQLTDGSGITVKNAVVNVTGGYLNIVAFFEELQKYHRRVWIDSVRLETGNSAGRLKCQLTLTLYCVDNTEMVSYE